MTGVPAVELVGVGRTYDASGGPLTVLDDVDLRIDPGEQVAIVGPSGSGKSTLLGIMGTLDTPTRGEVRIAGRSTAAMDDAERSDVRARSLGFVFQQFHLLTHVDAVANVELGMLYHGYPRSERRRRATDALERVGLGHRTDHRPSQLSGGEQQRVAIARAIAHGPALVLADEPTGALDQATGESVIELLLGLDDAAVAVITHDAAIAAHLGRQVRIQDGRIRSDSRTAGVGA